MIPVWTVRDVNTSLRAAQCSLLKLTEDSCFPPHCSTTGANTPGGPSKETLSCLLLAQIYAERQARAKKNDDRCVHMFFFPFFFLLPGFGMQCGHTWCPIPPLVSKKRKYVSKRIRHKDHSKSKEKSEIRTWVTGQDLHTPRLTRGLGDSGAVGVQQHRARAVRAQ